MARVGKIGVFLVRLQGYAIRKFLKINGLGNRDTVRLIGGEYNPNIDFQVIKVLPGGDSTKNRFVRRSGNERFIFQDRYLLRVRDTYCDTLTGVLFTKSRKIIEDSSSWNKDFLRASGFPRPFLKTTKMNNTSDCIILPSNGFYHWLIEDLPSFIRAIEDYPAAKVVLFEDSPLYAREFLISLGREFKSAPRYIATNSTIFLTRGDSSGWPDKRDIEILRAYYKTLLQNQILGKKVYVSRRFSSRSPAFEIELEKKLESMGWLVVHSERLHLEEQVRIFSSAKVICGVGGSGLSSIIWAETGSKLIELSPEWYSPCFSRLCATIGMDYHCILFEEPKLSLNSVLTKISEAAQY